MTEEEKKLHKPLDPDAMYAELEQKILSSGHSMNIERIRAAVRYAAVLAAAALLLFAVLWFFVRHWGKGHYDAWQSAAESFRRRGGG